MKEDSYDSTLVGPYDSTLYKSADKKQLQLSHYTVVSKQPTNQIIKNSHYLSSILLHILHIIKQKKFKSVF